MANNYGSGEKALIRGLEWRDVSVSVDVQIVRGDMAAEAGGRAREAGVLFRVTHPAVGYEAARGYFAGLSAAGDAVVLGRLDGGRSVELARAPLAVAVGAVYRMEVRAEGERISVSVNGQRLLSAEDATYRSGMVGVRGVDLHARFDDVRVAAIR